MLAVVFCSSAVFGVQCANQNSKIKIDDLSIFSASGFLITVITNGSLKNNNNDKEFERGKIAVEKFLLDFAFSGALNLPKEKLIAMRDAHKKLDLGRYQPKEQEVIRFVYDRAISAVSNIVATVIVAKHYEDRMEVAQMKQPEVQPMKVALALANDAAKEGLYVLICAEVHKHDSLAFARDYFPASNDPKELSTKKDCVKIAYNFLYGRVKSKIASYIPENLPL